MRFILKSLPTRIFLSALTFGSLAPVASADNLLSIGERLYANEQLTSENGFFSLTMESSGNLVLRRWDQVLWETDTSTSATPVLSFQSSDHNIVLYNTFPGWSSVWSATGTWNSGAEFLYIQNDGNLVAYTPEGQSVWSSGTWQFDMPRLLNGLSDTTPMQIRTANSDNLCLTNPTAGASNPSYANVNGTIQIVAWTTITSNISNIPVSAESCGYNDSLNDNWQYDASHQHISLTYKNHRYKVHANTGHVYYDDLVIAEPNEKLCIDVDGGLAAGNSVITQTCDTASLSQKWMIPSGSKRIQSTIDSSLCIVSSAGDVSVQNCNDPAYPDNQWAAFGY